jgi:hypothetical protein
MHLCEKELQGMLEGGAAPRTHQKIIEELDYFVEMSGEAIFIECQNCC